MSDMLPTRLLRLSRAYVQARALQLAVAKRLFCYLDQSPEGWNFLPIAAIIYECLQACPDLPLPSLLCSLSTTRAALSCRRADLQGDWRASGIQGGGGVSRCGVPRLLVGVRAGPCWPFGAHLHSTG